MSDRQLTLFELGPAPLPALAPQVVPEPTREMGEPQDETDDQDDLFDGRHVGQLAAEEAVGTLDPSALRTVHARVAETYPDYAPAIVWPTWATGLEWLIEPGPPEAQLERARALESTDRGRERFPGLGDASVRAARAAALIRVAESALAVSPALRLEDGSSPGHLFLEAGDWRRAAEVFAAAVAAEPRDVAFRIGRVLALDAGAQAAPLLVELRNLSLVDPAAATALIDLWPERLAELLDVVESADLPGEPAAWMPAIAHLRGVLLLPTVRPAPNAMAASSEPGTRFCVDLFELADLRRRRASESEVRPCKARLLALAPGLKALLRPA